MSKKWKIEEAVTNIEMAINSGGQDKAPGLLKVEDLKALFKKSLLIFNDPLILIRVDLGNENRNNPNSKILFKTCLNV